MNQTLRLPTTNPIAICGTRQHIWIADADSSTLAAFHPQSGEMLSQTVFDATPVALAVGEIVAVGLKSGSIVACDVQQGKELWRYSGCSGELAVCTQGQRIWVHDRESSTLSDCDQSGARTRLSGCKLTTFAAARNGVYWLSDDGILGYQPETHGESRTEKLAADSKSTGAMVVCSNVLWLSTEKELLLFDLNSLKLRTTLEATEGPVQNLICGDGRIFGGSRSIFTLDPAADALLCAVPVDLQSPLRGLAMATNKLWALESAMPVVHLIDVP